MFLAANLIEAVAYVLDWILKFYEWVIIIRAVISWVSPDPFNPIVQFLQRVTDPVLAPIQRRLQNYWLGIDLSPVVALIVIHFLRVFLIRSLFEWAGYVRSSIRGGGFY